MKSELIGNTGLKKKLKITVSPEEIGRAFDKEMSKIQKTAHLKGFRKGKAPIEQVKAAYDGEANQKIFETLVNDSYISALKEHNFTPIVLPQIYMDEALNSNIEKGEPFNLIFIAEFEIKPEVKLKPLSEVKVKAVNYYVKEEDVEREIELVRSKKAEMIPILEERPAKEKDWVKIDFSGTIKETGKPLKDGAAKDFTLELGSETLIPGFEDGILGMKVNSEKTINLKIPKDYFETEIAEKEVDFLVKLNSINKRALPELNDEFAQEVSTAETLEEYKDQIKQHLQNKAKQEAENELASALLTEFEKIHDIEVPEILMAEQIEDLKADTEKQLIHQKIPETEITEYHKKWEENYKEKTFIILKTFFLIEALAKQEDLYPTPEDITDYLADLSEKLNISMNKIQDYYKEQKNELEFKLMEQNVIQHIKDNATIEEY